MAVAGISRKEHRLPWVNVVLVSAILLLSSVLGSCSFSRETTFVGGQERPASDTPNLFLIHSAAESEWIEPDGSDACRSPIIDARDGTRGTLVRSVPGRGDYAFEAGHYGIRSGDLLRVDCRSGRAIGIVRG